MPERDRDCDRAREWLSAYRDAEALVDPAHEAHISRCGACRRWSASLDTVTRQAAVRRTGSPEVVAAALDAWDAQEAGPGAQERVARTLLGVAGAAALVLALLGLADVLGSPSLAGSHLGRELYAFEAALAVGFLLAAWQPARYAAALVPITVAVVLLGVAPSAAELVDARVDALREASHIPVLLGLVALLLHVDARRQRRLPLARGRTA